MAFLLSFPSVIDVASLASSPVETKRRNQARTNELPLGMFLLPEGCVCEGLVVTIPPGGP